MKITLLSALLCVTLSPAYAETTLTVLHGVAPEPTYLDLGTEGPSVGDQRIFQFGGQTTEGEAVILDFLMTTTGLPEDGSELESRITSAVLSFANSPNDRVLIEGIGRYPRAGSTVKVDATLERAVIGGTGRFGGARGTILSTHLPDGTWQHVLTLE